MRWKSWYGGQNCGVSIKAQILLFYAGPSLVNSDTASSAERLLLPLCSGAACPTCPTGVFEG